MPMRFPRGSEWHKWDLQVHAPGSNHADQYNTEPGADPWGLFLNELRASDVLVFGITDYFSVATYEALLERLDPGDPLNGRAFFPNIELRLDVNTNRDADEVNLHILFDPKTDLDQIKLFLGRLETTATKSDKTHYHCSPEDLATLGYQRASVRLDSVHKALQATFGSEKPYLIAGSYRGYGGFIYGTPSKQGESERKKSLSDEIDKSCNIIFGTAKDAPYFLQENRFEDASVPSLPKPVVATSDCHTISECQRFLGKHCTEDGRAIREITWIKAEPTFEGLRQILYEPEPGERVRISPTRPDTKDAFKVIRRIRFAGTESFPAEVEFNQNLCSIIGSRSSGKSALLAYLAHAVDPATAKRLRPDGPGDGEAYKWENITLDHRVEWANDKSNTESPGKVVYVPQNYLFQTSEDPEQIKQRIEPILLGARPTFAASYRMTLAGIETGNRAISASVDDWFTVRDLIGETKAALKGLGDKVAVQSAAEQIAQTIGGLKAKYQLDEESLVNYQDVVTQLRVLEARLSRIGEELTLLASEEPDGTLIGSVRISLSPPITSLPQMLQDELRKYLEGQAIDIRAEVNRRTREYRQGLETERESNSRESQAILVRNDELITKHKKNVELQELVEKLNGLKETAAQIDALTKTLEEQQVALRASGDDIRSSIERRATLLTSLKEALELEGKDAVENIAFGLELGWQEQLAGATQRVNVKSNTAFVERRELRLDRIRQEPAAFLEAIHAGDQKLIIREDAREVAKEILCLTEKIFFYADMEGDRIGGLARPTMTAGKRALFGLRLILAESSETWPLLIDQPEDDLDSRSVYDAIVPFLRKKKRERQIIMVSHNANLVVGADAEQIIVANRNGDDRKNRDGREFNYLSGGIECAQEKDESCNDTLEAQGIREHACEILDGGRAAFAQRANKYNLHP